MAGKRLWCRFNHVELLHTILLVVAIALVVIYLAFMLAPYLKSARCVNEFGGHH